MWWTSLVIMNVTMSKIAIAETTKSVLTAMFHYKVWNGLGGLAKVTQRIRNR